MDWIEEGNIRECVWNVILRIIRCLSCTIVWRRGVRDVETKVVTPVETLQKWLKGFSLFVGRNERWSDTDSRSRMAFHDVDGYTYWLISDLLVNSWTWDLGLTRRGVTHRYWRDGQPVRRGIELKSRYFSLCLLRMRSSNNTCVLVLHLESFRDT